MDLPDYSQYKDIHSQMLDDFPEVTMDRLNDYLTTCSKTFDKKCEELYNGGYIQYMRTCKSDDKIYVTDNIWAEMKKSVAYRTDIALDKLGVVQECQCECAVGQGPAAHCKHVSTSLYALSRFCLTGRILTELTCTQLVRVCMEDVKEIEERTQGLSNNKLWMEERRKRITASNFGTICKMTSVRNINQLVNSMISPTEFWSRSIQHGKKYEDIAVDKFERTTGLKTITRGMNWALRSSIPLRILAGILNHSAQMYVSNKAFSTLTAKDVT
ncbi:uncharacterized protein LOC141907863 [Tubulanus polymorphus]|uniref:uncharacterized protein LOC141907863 n=1 Tax=Tubulanus polymorphus TaxID=672921 RepID=UPI003DA4A9BC